MGGCESSGEGSSEGVMRDVKNMRKAIKNIIWFSFISIATFCLVLFLLWNDIVENSDTLSLSLLVSHPSHLECFTECSGIKESEKWYSFTSVWSEKKLIISSKENVIQVDLCDYTSYSNRRQNSSFPSWPSWVSLLYADHPILGNINITTIHDSLLFKANFFDDLFLVLMVFFPLFLWLFLSIVCCIRSCRNFNSLNRIITTESVTTSPLPMSFTPAVRLTLFLLFYSHWWVCMTQKTFGGSGVGTRWWYSVLEVYSSSKHCVYTSLSLSLPLPATLPWLCLLMC